MSDDSSFSPWLERVEQGDESAVRQLWESFFPRLSGVAQRVLEGQRIRSADEEDVALIRDIPRRSLLSLDL
jgi:hypothetical protein